MKDNVCFEQNDIVSEDLLELARLKKWSCYMPIDFINRSICGDDDCKKLFDEYIMLSDDTKRLNSKVEERFGCELDVTNALELEKKFDSELCATLDEKWFNKYNMGKFVFCKPSFGYPCDEQDYYMNKYFVSRYAKCKLTKDELEYCKSFLKKCDSDSSYEVAKAVGAIENFYVRSYAQFLLIHDPNSNYSCSIKVRRKSIYDSVQARIARNRRQFNEMYRRMDDIYFS